MPSARFVAATLAPNAEEVFAHLVTIEHASFPAPLRWCTSGADLTSNGRLFTAKAMKVVLPGESADRGGRTGRLTIDNVERANIAMLRQATSFPIVTIEVVLRAFPDDIELSWLGLEWRTQRPNVGVIEAEIAPRDDGVETFPFQRFSPHRCPGLYR